MYMDKTNNKVFINKNVCYNRKKISIFNRINRIKRFAKGELSDIEFADKLNY